MSTRLYNLRAEIADLQREEIALAEKELMERGCHRCGGAIDTDTCRRIVHMEAPCSIGNMMETFVVCADCHSKVYKLLNP